MMPPRFNAHGANEVAEMRAFSLNDDVVHDCGDMAAISSFNFNFKLKIN